ncbi:MAG: hypothetical protein CVV44_04855 [Spirochaetae bacterium HGW-Spirochaetae-1]|nr:MAG: hypothetical protein CVV44_04855 [Spirochaetae bacterium HGW-Spirochaetae-1]
MVSSIRILNFALNDEAADGYVNRYHGPFQVTGDEIVYDIPGATTADAVASRADSGAGEITGTTLIVAPGAGNYSVGVDADETDGQTVNVADSAFNVAGVPNAAAAYTVVLRAAMTTTGGPVDTANNLSIYCNEIEVTDIIFFNGGGVDNDPANYYRSLLVSGTQVRVNARLLAGGGAMIGNTTIELRDSTQNVITIVTIPNGANFGIAALNTTGITVAADVTDTHNHEIYNTYDGAFGSALTYGQHRNNATYITQPVTHRIHWENGDPPGLASPPFDGNAPVANGALFTSSTASSIRIEWNPVDAVPPAADGDFNTYRLYFRVYDITDTSPWSMIDRYTAAVYNAGGTYDLSDATTSFADITGLSALTTYEFIVSAADVYGNEVAVANRPRSDGTTILHAQTAASSVTITLSDGITRYTDTLFSDNDGSSKPVRQNAIHIIASIEGDTLPTSVNVIAAGDGLNQGVESDDNILNLVDNVTRFSFSMNKYAPNQWDVFIPTTHSLLTANTGVRFILEINTTTGTSYVDHNSELDLVGAATPWDDNEWRFWVNTTQPTFQPWPTRILNNVITKSNPVAYPAYYLSHDAYVTIKVYDIKGRPVTTLLDGAFRKGGQNIKDQGWRGTNKAQKRLGPGLYYIHIQAKRDDNGKIILNKMEKVVIAR